MPRFDITVAGELNLDLILYGLPEELAPERELIADRMTLTLGSSSAIVAHNLASLGSRVGFQSRIAEDHLGQMSLERLKQGGVDVSKVRCASGATTTGLTVILHHQTWRNILTYMGTIAELTWDDLDLDYLADARHFHLSSYFMQRALRPRVPELFRFLKSRGLSISLDTNDDPDDRWEGGLHELLSLVDVFLPNQREACKAAGTDNLEEAVEKLSKLVPLLVVKLAQKDHGHSADRSVSPVPQSPSLQLTPWGRVTASMRDSFTNTCAVPIFQRAYQAEIVPVRYRLLARVGQKLFATPLTGMPFYKDSKDRRRPPPRLSHDGIIPVRVLLRAYL